VQLSGIIIGAATFILIGLLHVAVIKVEYHLGAKYWPAFALAGIALVAASLLASNPIISGVLGAAGFAVAWSAPELIKQKERVKKGWYPKKER
jgi:hypothetical protein